MLERILSAARWLVFAGLAFACVGVLYVSPSFRTCVQQEQHQAANNDQDKNKSILFISARTIVSCTGGFVHDRHDAIVAAFAVLLGFATIFLWIATRDLVSGSERTARHQLRAYVFIQGGEMRVSRNADVKNTGFVETRLLVKNFGQTPGINFRTWIKSDVGMKFDTPFKIKEDFHSRSIIGPTADANLSVTISISEDQFKEVNDGVMCVFTWGIIRYDDAFGKPRHLIFRCQNNGAAGTKDWSGWALQPHEKGYEAN